MITGHSEGGVVVAHITNKLNHLITDVCIIAGEGPSQLYSLYKLATEGVFFNKPDFSENDRIDSLLTVWKQIQKDSLSTNKKFWGFTYKRWYTFLSTSVYDELINFKGNIRIVQGSNDKNVSPESAKVLYVSLLSKGKKVHYVDIPGADHSLNISSQPELNGWQKEVQHIINWFLE